MRALRLAAIFGIAAFLFVFNPTGTSDATPGAGGPLLFSVSTIYPIFPPTPPTFWDITPVPEGVSGLGLTCTSADVMLPGPIGGIACAPRVGPAPPGPVPAGLGVAPVDLGLNLVGGVFTDDLDGLSYGEAIGAIATPDYDFSVDAAPPNGGMTVGIPGCGPAPNVGTQAGALEAQGDIFTTAAPAPAGCNVQFTDEAALGLIPLPPPSPFPGAPPLDNVDALAEISGFAGPCTYAGGLIDCSAFTVSAGSAVLPAIPPSFPPCFGLPADGATILVPPGTPGGGLNCTPFPCPPGGTPCIAVDSLSLGLVPFGDDIDALCWFDINGNAVPDLPMSFAGPGGDMYIFSLTPGSASVVGGPGYSAADVLGTRGLVFGPTVIRTAASLGLLPSDNVDGLICHQTDTDADGSDGIPDDLDNCPTLNNPTQADLDGDGLGNVCDVDDDGDGVNDDAEALGACGADPLNGGLRPERLDGIFSGVSDDGDIPIDEALPSPASDPFDCDGDGWTGSEELALYSVATTVNDQDPCDGGAPSYDGSSNGWPGDLDNNNAMGGGDLNSFLFPLRLDLSFNKFGHPAGEGPATKRWDLDGNGTIGGGDLNALNPGVIAPTARPPMLNGQIAFGQFCPWP